MSHIPGVHWTDGCLRIAIAWLVVCAVCFGFILWELMDRIR